MAARFFILCYQKVNNKKNIYVPLSIYSIRVS